MVDNTIHSNKAAGQVAPPIASLETKKALLYSKIYKKMALGAAVFGLIASGYLYNEISGGDFDILFKRPAVLLNLLVPFIPSLVLLILSGKAMKKCIKLAKKDGFDIKSLHK